MHNIFHNQTMRERKGWTQSQDEVLKLLIEVRGQIKWSAIARIMQQQYSICGKTGKQCRQRYHNHLKSTISNGDWTQHQDKQLLKLHQQFGNKWSVIAQRIPGRAQNCVKNHFYSKLRKVVRKLNRLKAEYSSQGLYSIPKSILSRIIEVSESRFKLSTKISQEWVLFCMRTPFNLFIELISRLYNYQSNLQQNTQNQQNSFTADQIIHDINHFQQNFKKKKVSKKDTSQGVYRQRRNSSFKIKKSCKRLKNEVKVQPILYRDGIHKMESFKTQIQKEKGQTLQKLSIYQENMDIQLENGNRQPFKHSNFILRQRLDERNNNFKSFDNFCEFDSVMKWHDNKIRILEQESDSYGNQYGYLLEP